MKISLLFFSLAVMLPANSFSQNDNTQQLPDFKRHSVYLELLGNSKYYSVNYDYLFRIYRNNIKLAVGAGISYFQTGYNPDGQGAITIHNYYFTPEVNFLFGGKSHYCEIGTALMVDFFSNETDFVPSPRIGYRYQPPKGGFLFRIAYTPLFTEHLPFKYYWGGVSFGYIF
jgi:hypothetical protein